MLYEKVFIFFIVSLLFLLSLGVVFLHTLSNPYAAESRVFHKLKSYNGIDVNISPKSKVAQAVIAVEDERYYTHHGIDAIGILRALFVNVSSGTVKEGASTISQQLAKALYISDDNSFNSKIRMMGMAFKLENSYSKGQILEMYLNSIYYGAGQWGINQASKFYFSKNPEELDWSEASLLTGLVQAPSAYDPTKHFDLARQRQRQVLNALVRTQVLRSDEANSAYNELNRFA